MKAPRPPRLAFWLMNRLTPSQDADVVLGDLAEEFQKRIAHDGVDSARRWYVEQTRRGSLA